MIAHIFIFIFKTDQESDGCPMHVRSGDVIESMSPDNAWQVRLLKDACSL